MLRIVTHEQGNGYTLSLHGRLADAWVELVQRQWESILEAASPSEVSVVLADVSFIDGDGEQLLERMWRRGTRLEASGCMNRHILEKIRAGTSRPGRVVRGASGRRPEKGVKLPSTCRTPHSHSVPSRSKR